MAYGAKKIGAGLLGKAASDDDMDEADESDAQESDEEMSPDAERKRCFISMAKAIKSGDFEAAWKQYQECEELEKE